MNWRIFHARLCYLLFSTVKRSVQQNCGLLKSLYFCACWSLLKSWYKNKNKENMNWKMALTWPCCGFLHACLSVGKFLCWHTQSLSLSLPLDEVPTSHSEAWTKWPPFRRRHVPMQFHERNVLCLIEISRRFVPWGGIDDMSALDQAMPWRRTGDKPLPEQIMRQSVDQNMRHRASVR